MSGGWAIKDVSNGTARTIAGVVSNTVADTGGWALTPGGATVGIVIKISVSAINVVGSVTVKLQTAIGNDWVDAKTVALTVTGAGYIKLMHDVVADAALMPLLNKGRIVVSNTNAADSVTISKIEVLQEL